MTKFDELLKSLRAQVERQRKLRSMLESLYAQQRELSARERELAAIRAHEQADVDRLEGRSLAAFFYDVVGKMGEKLDKEKAEARAAAVKHDAVKRELEAVEYHIRSAETELGSLKGCEKRYAETLEQKAAAVKARDPKNAAEIMRLEDRIAHTENQIREIEEAISAGGAALDTANSIASSLSSAEGWGTWDLLGGGLLSGIAKYGHMDDAQREVENLQVQLDSFRTELADVEISSDLRVGIDGFLRFADFFFDGLFADWAALSHIHSSQEQIYATGSQIEDVLGRLDSMKSAAEHELGRLKAELDSLILNA